MGLLAGALSPVVARSVRKQKGRTAQADVAAIRDAVLAFINDVREGGFSQDAALSLGKQRSVSLAVGDGDIPELGASGSPAWTQPVNLGAVDFLANHLATNRPGNDPGRGYRNWRGSYITAPVRPDPWGNRYMVNAVYIWAASGLKYDAVALSAGPNEIVESRFTQDGFLAGGDDIAVIISSGRGTRSAPPP